MKIRAICEDNFLSLTYSFFVSNIVTFFVFLRFEKNKAMNIDVEYLEEAQSYIDAMPDKARKKLFYNISLVSMGVVDSRIFKKLGESRIWRATSTDCFRFGTKHGLRL